MQPERGTEQDVEGAAVALFGAEYRTVGETWEDLTDVDRDSYRRVVRAVLGDLASQGRLRQPGDRPEWEVLHEAASDIRRDDGLLPLHLQFQITAWLDRRANAAESRAGRQP